MKEVCIIFERPIRLGSRILKVVGPFPDVDAAVKWLHGDFAVPLPRSMIETIGQG